MTLSSWARDYIFTPVGARAFASPLRRRPMAIASLSYLTSFLVVGAWHGLTANFLLWGLYHGVLLSGHHVYRRTVAARLATNSLYQSTAVRAASIGSDIRVRDRRLDPVRDAEFHGGRASREADHGSRMTRRPLAASTS